MYSGRSPTRRSSSATRSSRSRAVAHAVAPAAARRRCRAASCAGSARRTDPGRSSASRAAAAAAPRRGSWRHVDHGAVGGANRIWPRGRLDRAQDAARGRGLAAAALADQRQRLALVDVEADAVHRPHVADRPLQEALPDGKELLEARATSSSECVRRGRRHGCAFVEEAARRVRRAPTGCERRLAARSQRAGHELRAARMERAARSAGCTGCGIEPAIVGSRSRVARADAGDRAQQRPGVRMPRRRGRSRRPAPARPPGPGTSPPRRWPSRRPRRGRG